MPYDEHGEHVEQHTQSLEAFRKEQAEEVRVERWHVTYNAALTGLCANRSEPKDPRHHEIHLDARIMADIAHGALVKA